MRAFPFFLPARPVAPRAPCASRAAWARGYAVFATLAALACALVLGLLPRMASAQAVQPVPALTARVIDQTGTLGAAQRQALESRLADFERRKGTQIVVLMVARTAPEDIASYAHRVAASWKIGRKKEGDGVLVVVAKDERRMRIEVARALEGALPDIAAARILDQQMKPAFARGDYAGGLDAALTQLMARIEGEGLPAPAGADAPPGTATPARGLPGPNGAVLAPGAGQASGTQAAPRGAAGIDWQNLAMFGFFGVLVVGPLLRRMFGRGLGTLVTGGGAALVGFLLTASIAVALVAGVGAMLVAFVLGARAQSPLGRAPIIFPGGYGGGFGGGGFGGGGLGGGGGFSSGGGGSFGGGGASGDW